MLCRLRPGLPVNLPVARRKEKADHIVFPFVFPFACGQGSLSAALYLAIFFSKITLDPMLIAAIPAKKTASAELPPLKTLPT